MLINDRYDDYHLFQDFSNLIVKVKTDHSLYDFSYNETETGIIFPFYIEDKIVKAHDLKKLCLYTANKCINNTSPDNIKKSYQRLILLIKDLTRNNDMWQNFFNSYSFEF